MVRKLWYKRGRRDFMAQNPWYHIARKSDHSGDFCYEMKRILSLNLQRILQSPIPLEVFNKYRFHSFEIFIPIKTSPILVTRLYLNVKNDKSSESGRLNSTVHDNRLSITLRYFRRRNLELRKKRTLLVSSFRILDHWSCVSTAQRCVPVCQGFVVSSARSLPLVGPCQTVLRNREAHEACNVSQSSNRMQDVDLNVHGRSRIANPSGSINSLRNASAVRADCSRR